MLTVNCLIKSANTSPNWFSWRTSITTLTRAWWGGQYEREVMKQSLYIGAGISWNLSRQAAEWRTLQDRYSDSETADIYKVYITTDKVRIVTQIYVLIQFILWDKFSIASDDNFHNVTIYSSE